MKNVVEKLKQEHKTLALALEKVDASMIGTEAGTKILFVIKDAILAHLKHEDEEFYPVLREIAKSEETVAKMLKEFDAELAKITEFILMFFEKYTRKSAGNGFDTDFAQLVSGLQQRMKIEEDILFKL